MVQHFLERPESMGQVRGKILGEKSLAYKIHQVEIKSELKALYKRVLQSYIVHCSNGQLEVLLKKKKCEEPKPRLGIHM